MKLNEELWGNYICTCDGCFNYLTKRDHFDTIPQGKYEFHLCHANDCYNNPLYKERVGINDQTLL